MTIYSYSRVNAYFTCPAQFEFRYILKTPSPSPEGAELFLGSRFHEVMEFLYGELPRRLPTVNELLDHFKRHWEAKWRETLIKQEERGFSTPLRIVQEGQTVGDYHEKGLLYLENYYHQYQPFDQDETQGIERKVLFNLDPEGRYRMQGFIDRLGRDDEGTLWIHDYKTSSRKLSEEDARSEDQLALYQVGLSQDPQFGPGAKVKLAWHFVAFEKGLVVSERNPREIEWLKKKYVSKIQEIEKAKAFPAKPGRLCEWCEYLPLCAPGQASVGERRKKFPRSKVDPSPERTVPAPPTILPVVPNPPAVLPVRSGRKKAGLPTSPDQLPLFPKPL